MATKSNTQNPASALYGAGAGFAPEQPTPIGGVVLRSEDIEYNVGRPTTKLTVRNTGDRPIQVGSHFHFFEVNRYLEFDRDAAFGTHLNIPATTAIRFEPGDEREVEVVPFAGKQRMIGFNSLVMGYAGIEDDPVYYPSRIAATARMHKRGFACCCNNNKNSEKR
ncbi:MAG: urease subunit beta [Rikenellaceae bacterium]|nr:urease subunit beta [Rikenellaceae bacterium]